MILLVGEENVDVPSVLGGGGAEGPGLSRRGVTGVEREGMIG